MNLDQTLNKFLKGNFLVMDGEIREGTSAEISVWMSAYITGGIPAGIT